MKIRLLTWNMAYWQHKNIHKEAWAYLLDEIGADIILFQEGRPLETIEIKKQGQRPIFPKLMNQVLF